MSDNTAIKQKIREKLAEVGGGSMLFVSIFKYKSDELKFADVMEKNEAIETLEKIIKEVVALARADKREWAWSGDLWNSETFLSLIYKRRAYIYGVLVEQFARVIDSCVYEKSQNPEIDEIDLFWQKVLELAEQNLPPFVPVKDVYLADEK